MWLWATQLKKFEEASGGKEGQTELEMEKNKGDKKEKGKNKGCNWEQKKPE